MGVKISGCVGKGGENNHFTIVGVDRIFNFVFENLKQLLKLAVVFGRDIFDHIREKLEHFEILLEIMLPGFVIHIAELDFNFLSEGKKVIIILILGIEIINIGHIGQIKLYGMILFIVIDFIKGIFYLFLDTLECQGEREDGALHTLHQVDGIQTTQTKLTVLLSKTDIDCVIFIHLCILLFFERKDVMRRQIDI